MDNATILQALVDHTINNHWDIDTPVRGAVGMRLRKVNTYAVKAQMRQTKDELDNTVNIQCLNLYGQPIPMSTTTSVELWDIYSVSGDQFGPIAVDIPHNKLTPTTTITAVKGATIVTTGGLVLPLLGTYCMITGDHTDGNADEFMLAVPLVDSNHINRHKSALWLKLIVDSAEFSYRHEYLSSYVAEYGPAINAGNMPFTLADGKYINFNTTTALGGYTRFTSVTGSNISVSTRLISTYSEFSDLNTKYKLHPLPKIYNPSNLVIKPDLLDIYVVSAGVGVNITEDIRRGIKSITHSAFAIDSDMLAAALDKHDHDATSSLVIVVNLSGLMSLASEANNLLGLYLLSDAEIEQTLLESSDTSDTPYWCADTLINSTYIKIVTDILPDPRKIANHEIFLEMYTYENIIGILSDKVVSFILPTTSIVLPALYRDINVALLVHKDGLFVEPASYGLVISEGTATFDFSGLGYPDGTKIDIEIVPQISSYLVFVPPYGERSELFFQRRIKRVHEDYILLMKTDTDWVDCTPHVGDYVDHRTIDGTQWLYFDRELDHVAFVVSFGTGGMHTHTQTTAGGADTLPLKEDVSGYFADRTHILKVSHEMYDMDQIGDVRVGPFVGTVGGGDIDVPVGTSEPANTLLSDDPHPMAMEDSGINLPTNKAIMYDIEDLVIERDFDPALLEISYVSETELDLDAIQTFSQIAGDMGRGFTAVPYSDSRMSDLTGKIDKRYRQAMLTKIKLNDTPHEINWPQTMSNSYPVRLSRGDLIDGKLFMFNNSGNPADFGRLAKTRLYLKNSNSKYIPYLDKVPMFAMQNTIVILDGLRLIEGLDYTIEILDMSGVLESHVVLTDPSVLNEAGHSIHVYAYRDVNVSYRTINRSSGTYITDDAESVRYSKTRVVSIVLEGALNNDRVLANIDQSLVPIFCQTTIIAEPDPPVFGPMFQYPDPIQTNTNNVGASSFTYAFARMTVQRNMIINLAWSTHVTTLLVGGNVERDVNSILISNISRLGSGSLSFSKITVEGVLKPVIGFSGGFNPVIPPGPIVVIDNIPPTGLQQHSITEMYVADENGNQTVEIADISKLSGLKITVHLDEIPVSAQPNILIGSIMAETDTPDIMLNPTYLSLDDEIYSVATEHENVPLTTMCNPILIAASAISKTTNFTHMPGHIVNIVDGLFVEESYDPAQEGIQTFKQHKRVGFFLEAFNLIEELLYFGQSTQTLLQ